MPGIPQQVGEPFQVAGPVGEDQAVAILAKCGEDVRDDLPGALLIGGQVPVDGRHATRTGRVGIAVVLVRGRVDVQHGDGPAGARKGVLAGWVAGKCDGVPNWSHLHGDQVVEPVAAVWGGGQPEPAPGRDLLDRVLERRGRDVVAFVGDD
jgi:hypothetical protein